MINSNYRMNINTLEKDTSDLNVAERYSQYYNKDREADIL
jgi:hypothetical protein